MTFRTLRCLLGLTCVVATVGCGPSPQPLPPPIDISISGLTVSAPSPGVVRLSGGEGTAVSADTVEVIDITGETMASIQLGDANVAADGSFSIDFQGELTDTFRLQAYSTVEATGPVDVIGTVSGAVLDAPRVGCLTANQTPEFVVDGTTAMPTGVDLTLTNECVDALGVEEAAVLDDVTWLLDNTGLLPADVGPEGQLGFGVVFSPETVGDQTNVVAFRVVQGAVAHWRVFTVRGRASE